MLVEDVAAQIVRGCDRVESEIDAAVAAAPAVIDAALDGVRVGWPVAVPLPDAAKDVIREAILAAVDEAAAVIREAIDLFRTLAKAVGRPSALRAAAQTLSDSVVSATSSIADAMTPTSLLATSSDSWQSKAADSYQTAYAEQSNSVDDVPPIARTLAETLSDLADSIESFFQELGYAYAGFAVAVGGLAVAIATAGPTLGVGTVIGIVLAVVSFIMAVYSLVMAFTNSASRNSSSAENLAGAEALSWTTSAFAS